jgi:hypothetical protein
MPLDPRAVTEPKEPTMLDRVILFVVGLPLAISGLGLTAAFGLFAFIGIPLMILGLACISASVTPDA